MAHPHDILFSEPFDTPDWDLNEFRDLIRITPPRFSDEAEQFLELEVDDVE